VWPKEHGAYGQLTLPVVTALAGAGVSTAGLAVAIAAAACFLAHEPASILLGLRGVRAKREQGRAAARWLGWCALTAAAAGAVSLMTIPDSVGWSLAVPVVPAALLAVVTMSGREKSWYGETLAAIAFSALAVPIAMSAGSPAAVAVAIALPFALLFVTSTLAVRSVILRVRGGGDPRASAATGRSAAAIMASGAAGTAWLSWLGVLPAETLGAIGPGLLAVLAIVMRPPPPTRLRNVGWTLVAISVLTGMVVIASF